MCSVPPFPTPWRLLWPQALAQDAIGLKRGRGDGSDAFEGNRPQRRPQRRLGRRLEEVAEAVWGRLLSVTNAIEAGIWRQGQWLGIGWAPWRGEGGGRPPPFQCSPGGDRPLKNARAPSDRTAPHSPQSVHPKRTHPEPRGTPQAPFPGK